MIIHVVQPGETLSIIATQYGVSIDRLALDNAITDHNRLVPGEALLILFPDQTYIIQEGDTLSDIASIFNMDIWQLLRNNPHLSDREFLYPGEQIVISYYGQNNTTLNTNGYTFPFIDKNELKKTLPYLTYLTIFSYQISSEGNLITINDEEILQIAREYEVAPIMLVSPLTSLGILDTSIAQNIIHSIDKQNTLIFEVLSILNTKGYHGVNLDFQYIYTQDNQRFVEFVERFTTIIRREGYQVFITISPTIFEIRTGTIHGGIDYHRLSQITDKTILLTYDWCTVRGYPLGFFSLSSYENYLNYVISQVDPSKLILGISTLGYIWQYPFINEGSIGNLITYQNALEMARVSESAIQFYEPSATPYFYFSYVNDYFVWFRDVRSIEAYTKSAQEYGITGLAYWNIMLFCPCNWLFINYLYEITKLP